MNLESGRSSHGVGRPGGEIISNPDPKEGYKDYDIYSRTKEEEEKKSRANI